MYKIVNNYELYEYNTDNVIHVDKNKNKNKIQKLYKTLMSGTGFNGNTPPFFSNNYSQSINKKNS